MEAPHDNHLLDLTTHHHPLLTPFSGTYTHFENGDPSKPDLIAYFTQSTSFKAYRRFECGHEVFKYEYTGSAHQPRVPGSYEVVLHNAEPGLCDACKEKQATLGMKDLSIDGATSRDGGGLDTDGGEAGNDSGGGTVDNSIGGFSSGNDIASDVGGGGGGRVCSTNYDPSSGAGKP